MANGIWLQIWKLKILQRIRIFLWLLMHGKMLTNVERMRRGFKSNPNCHCCVHEMEDLNHIFRDCNRAKSFWVHFSKEDFRKSAHILPFLDWICWNLEAKLQGYEGS